LISSLIQSINTMMYTNMNTFDDISMDGMYPTDFSAIMPQHRMKRERSYCAICGAKATGINFDVLTCSSCKAFFRRNGIKPLDQFVCRLSGDCKVDERSRRQCTACRLRKCFAMGMIKERIRTQEQNQRHRALVEENRRLKLRKFQEKDHHRMRDFGDDENIRSRCQSMGSTISTILPMEEMTDVDFIYEIFMENTQQIIPENFILELGFDVTAVLNSHCLPMSSLITFVKQLPHFQQLPVDDRLILLKNNTKVLTPMFLYLLNLTFDVQLRLNHPGVQNLNNKIVQAYSLFAYLVPDDQKLLTLLITVFLFCPCLFTNQSLHDAGNITEHSRHLIREAYDEYTLHLWNYILEKSMDDETQATMIFTKIVLAFVRLQSLASEIYDIIECSAQIDQLHMLMQSILHLT